MKKSKRAKSSKIKDGVDRISNLSDDILHLILSCLPTTEEVVRTCILSTRWRYLWTSFSYSSLDIDFTRTLKARRRLKMNKFKKFIDRVLVNESVDLDNFRLCCSNYYNMTTVGRWIDAAITRKVKILHLMLCPRKELNVPHCLVTNGSLEVLRLVLSGSTLNLPNFTGLPALRVLELNNVKLVNHGLVKEFLNSCPLLEDLSLIDCWLNGLRSLCISCPKLKNLKIDNRKLDQGMTVSIKISCPKLEFWEVAGYIYHNFIFENLDSLKKVVFHPELFRLRFEEPIAEIFHPGSFAFDIYSDYERGPMTERSNLIGQWLEPEVDVPLLSPKTLEVTTTIDFLTKDALTHLLIYFPNLESLHLTIIEGPFWPTLYSNLVEDRLLILTEHLKRVEFVDFNGEKEKLFVARSLLKYGHVLEEMVFSWGSDATYRERSMETMKEVSEFHKDSSTVKLISLLKS